MRKLIVIVVLIVQFVLYNNLFSQNDNLLNFSEFSKLDHLSKYKYLNNRIYSFNKFNFPDAAYNLVYTDGGSSRVVYYPRTKDRLIITDIKELQASNYKGDNIKNTIENIKQTYGKSLFTNYFYQNDEFGEGIYHPFVENYFRFNDSLFLRTVIFFEQKKDLFYIKSDYNTSFDIVNIYKETKFDLHLVIYHKDLLENRLIYLKKEYSERKKYNDYKDQIKKIKEFLKFLNSK